MRAYSVEGKRRVVRMATRTAMVAPMAAGAGVFASTLLPATAASAATTPGRAVRPFDVAEHCNNQGINACGALWGSVGAHNQGGSADGFSNNNDCHQAELFNATTGHVIAGPGDKICGPHYIALAIESGPSVTAGEYYSYILDDNTGGNVVSSLDIGQMKN
jgi:hypothetical protein